MEFINNKKGSIYIDNTTRISRNCKRNYKSAKAHGFGFLDAPVSGGKQVQKMVH